MRLPRIRVLLEFRKTLDRGLLIRIQVHVELQEKRGEPAQAGSPHSES